MPRMNKPGPPQLEPAPQLEPTPALTLVPKAFPDLEWVPPDLYEWLEEEPPSARWVIEGFLPHDAFVLLSGQRKMTNKTYTSRLMMASASTGRHLGPFKPDRRYKTLFVEEEGAHGENWDAWKAVCRTYDIDPRQYQGQLFWSFRQLVQLNSFEWRQRLVRFVRAAGIEVVLFDALFLMVTGDENDSSTMRDVLGTLQEIRACGCTVVLLAHLNDHRGADPGTDVDLQIRGSGLLKDAYDLHLAARRYDPAEKYIQWTVRRRGGAESKYKAFWDIEGPKHGAPDTAKLEVYELDEGLDEAENLLAMLIDGKSYTASECDELWQVARKRGQMIRKGLCDRGYMERIQGGFKVLHLADAEDDEDIGEKSAS